MRLASLFDNRGSISMRGCDSRRCKDSQPMPPNSLVGCSLAIAKGGRAPLSDIAWGGFEAVRMHQTRLSRLWPSLNPTKRRLNTDKV